MKNNKKITLKDIAIATGLGTNTVSKVLNKKPYYSKEVEEKILKAVKELGYIPNTIAANLRRGSSNTIAIVFDDLINPYYSFMTFTIAQILSKNKYNLMMFTNFGESSFLEPDLLSQIMSRKTDAIISFIEPDGDSVEMILKSNIPFLLLGRNMQEKGIDSLYSNDCEGGRIATTHLIETGHKKIAYVGAHPDISIDKMRFSGYKKALEENNIQFNPQNVCYFSDFKSIDLLTKHLVKNIDANAIFCFNDIFSFGIKKELHELGFSLPKDYSLVGYDNIQKYLSLPKIITTIGINNKKIAALSAEIILAKIQNPENYPKITETNFEPILIKGETT